MAKFCIKCGKSLEEGKECTCTTKDTLTQTKQVARNYVNLFLEIMKGLVKAPIDTIKKYGVEKNFGFSAIAMLFNSFLFGLFFYCILKEETNAFSYGFLISRDIPLIKTILLGTLLIGIGFLVTIFMIYILAGSLLKAKAELKVITSMIGICSIIMTVALAISIIIVFLSMKLAMFILLIASLFYFVYLLQGINEISKIDKNKLAYVFVPTICVTLFVVVYIVPKILF